MRVNVSVFHIFSNEQILPFVWYVKSMIDKKITYLSISEMDWATRSIKIMQNKWARICDTQTLLPETVVDTSVTLD